MSQKLEPMFLGAMATKTNNSGSGGAYIPPFATNGAPASASAPTPISTAAPPQPPPTTLEHYPALRS